jgi:hypothetical protein
LNIKFVLNFPFLHRNPSAVLCRRSFFRKPSACIQEFFGKYSHFFGDSSGLPATSFGSASGVLRERFGKYAGFFGSSSGRFGKSPNKPRSAPEADPKDSRRMWQVISKDV